MKIDSAQPAAKSNHARFSLSEIVAAANGEIVGLLDCGTAALVVEGVESDTRKGLQGALFVALRGEKFDGHDFLDQAIAGGAAIALVDKLKTNSTEKICQVCVEDTLQAYGSLARAHRRRFAIPVVGVTGSYGKTTTRALIAAALGAKWKTLASSGNFNNEVGVPQTLLQLEEGHEAAVIEMGMRGSGQIEYLANIAEPTVGVITNIGPQHIELLGSIENIAAAKAELIAALPNDGLAVLPADDTHIETLLATAACRVVTFGESEGADYRVTAVRPDTAGNTTFDIVTPQTSEAICVALPLPGAHNARNAAAALAVAVELGVPLKEAIAALEKAVVPGARMRVVKNEARGLTIIDDCYNAGPDSMRAALQVLADYPDAKRRVAVLGAMRELGDWTEAEHRKLGEQVVQVADVVIFVAEETRIAQEVVAGSNSEIETYWCAGADEAAQKIGEFVQAGDVVLVKGSRSVGLETVVRALV